MRTNMRNVLLPSETYENNRFSLFKNVFPIHKFALMSTAFETVSEQILQYIKQFFSTLSIDVWGFINFQYHPFHLHNKSFTCKNNRKMLILTLI